ncbi:RNA polymerase [Dipodascopsis tothii]|uniref:RNA polymerase n=1 Tax=Dipodascopsis tothii TaxID=44089 RepID=UPI0034D0014F
MKVETVRDSLLSNYEVLEHISAFKSRPTKKKGGALKSENLETIMLELKSYLEASPASRQTPEQIQAFVAAAKPYELEKAELLQIINLAPSSMVTLHSLIEECDERLTEPQKEELLALVGQHLSPDASVMAEE